MHARRTAYLLTAALLTAGCVAVPHGPAPDPTDRPAALAPAAERAPAPLPTWPDPTPAAPREALATTEPRTAPAPAPASPRPTAAAPPPERTRKETGRKKEPTKKNRTRAVPRLPKKNQPPKKDRPRSRPSAPAGQPELRRLCRQAERIDAPMGAADLCRRVYGP
ncbi:hypothetical protein [Streptomyces cinereoruber]|uniref:hypothetical protein n=1 Tax=Streptomyces cinereoruber TaxID=67260 RepID=UPI003629BBC7